MDAVFVGRRAELGMLAEALGKARSGSPAVVVVEGAAGEGKSCLLRQFMAQAGGSQFVCAIGDAAETEVAYALFDELMLGLERVRRGTAGAPAHALRARDVGADLLVTGEALLELLRRSEGGPPLVLLIDDAFMADRPSLAALTYAVRRLRTAPVLTIVATRSDEIPRLPSGLLRLAESEGVWIALPVLTPDEIRELAKAHGLPRMTDRVARRLRDHTGGSPLHLRALLSELGSAQVDLVNARLPPPRPFARLVRAQVAGLSRDARRLASATAVLGLRASLGDAAYVGDITDPSPPAQELQAARVVEVVPDRHGLDLVFTHTLVRQAIYDGMGPASRAALHRAAASLLRGREALFHLGTATACPDHSLAAQFEAQAVEDLAVCSWRPAAEALLEAARLTLRGSSRDSLQLRAVDAMLIAGDLAAAGSYRAEIAAMPRSTRRLQVEARLAWLNGRFDEAERLAVEAWSSAEDLDDMGRDRLAALLSQMCIMQGRNAEAIGWAQEALRSGRLDARSRASTVATCAAAMSIENRADEALAMLPADGDLNDAGYRELVGIRGILQLLADDPTSAVANFRIRLRPNVDHHYRGQSPIELLTATAPDGIEPNKLIILALLAEAEYRRGNWDVAIAVSEQATVLIEDTEQAWIAPWVHSIATLIQASRGQWQIAEFHLSTAQAGAAQFGNELIRGYVDDAAIHLATCRSDPGGVVAAAQWLLTEARPYHQEPGMHSWPVNYASALVAMGRFVDAAAALDRWEAVAQARGRRSRLGGLARVRAEMAARQGDLTVARDAFDAAERIGEGASDPLERAVLFSSRGAFLRRRGQRRAAAADLGKAERLLLDLGAEPFLAIVRLELQACGLDSSPGARNAQSHVPVLTPQEKAVARLVAAGHTNKEVAESLFLSPKTVSYHLEHVYTKLGVRSRAQLAARRAAEATSRQPSR